MRGNLDMNSVIRALFDMINQFAYHTDNGLLWTGGLSALEYAFDVLDLPDPCSETLFNSRWADYND